MIWEELKIRKNFVEEDFIELRDSVEEIIKIFEKYKKLTDKELINLVELRRTYFNFHDNSLSEYGVYDKDDLEKTHRVNREITVVIERLKKILYKITEKIDYHIS